MVLQVEGRDNVSFDSGATRARDLRTEELGMFSLVAGVGIRS